MLDRQRFDGQIGHMRSYRPSYAKDPYLWELPMLTKQDREAPPLQFFLSPKGVKFEWRHPHDMFFAWWLQQYIAEYVAFKLKGKVFDEGVPESWRPDYFIKYPTVRDWVENLSDISQSDNSKVAINQILKDYESFIPSDLWAVVSETNGFEKQFDIQLAK
jgi:hypothetical protein